MVRFRAVAIGWYADEPQPGLVEVSVRDASGREHRIIEKNLVISPIGLDFMPDSTYPIDFGIDGLDELIDGDLVSVTLPWSMETSAGTTRLTFSRADVEFF